MPDAVEPITTANLAEVQALAASRLGPGYVSWEGLGHESTLALCLRREGEVVGYFLTRVLGFDALCRQDPRLDASGLARHFGGDERLALLQSLAVSADHERSGVAARLLTEARSRLRARGITRGLVTAWKTRAGGVHVRGLLGHVQALELLEIPNYWAGITTCPEPSCRGRSCCCTCVVYGVTL